MLYCLPVTPAQTIQLRWGPGWLLVSGRIARTAAGYWCPHTLTFTDHPPAINGPIVSRAEEEAFPELPVPDDWAPF